MTTPESPATVSSSAQAAGLLRQLAALVYDALLVLAVLLLATVLSTAVVALLAPGWQQADPGALRNHPLHLLYLLGCWFGYYAWSWLRGGQTLGMKAWRLHLVNNSGERLRLAQCLMRFLSAGLGLGLLPLLLPGQKFSLQDRCSATDVVYRPKTAA